MSYINLNGKMITADKAAIAPDNRAFRYGYGLFETMLYRNGVLELRELHFERLLGGLQQLGVLLPLLLTQEWLEEQVALTVKRNGLSHRARVRLQVYAGDGGLYEKDTHAGFVIECFPIEEAALQFNDNGLVVGIAEGLCKSPDTLANLKSCNALIYAMAAHQAMTNKWNDALILNTSNNVIESTIANIFWIKDEVVYTPPLQDGCVAGVMRDHVMTTLLQEGMAVLEQSLDIPTLMLADEVFLTNAIRKMRWIRSVGDKECGREHSRYLWKKVFS